MCRCRQRQFADSNRDEEIVECARRSDEGSLDKTVQVLFSGAEGELMRCEEKEAEQNIPRIFLFQGSSGSVDSTGGMERRAVSVRLDLTRIGIDQVLKDLEGLFWSGLVWFGLGVGL